MVGLRHVVGLRFQVLFHSPRRGSFRLSLTVLLLYRSYLVFSLGSWSTRIPAGFLVPRRTQAPPYGASSMPRTGISPSLSGFPNAFPLCLGFLQLRPLRAGGPTTPDHSIFKTDSGLAKTQSQKLSGRVWAPPVSLAATSGISSVLRRY